MDTTLAQLVGGLFDLNVQLGEARNALAAATKERDDMRRALTDATAQLTALLKERSEVADLVKEQQ